VDIIGNVSQSATLTINNQRPDRTGDYFRYELTIDNNGAAVYQGVTNLAVVNNGTNADIIATNIGSVFLPESPEVFGYDSDGNLTNDGRWTFSWNDENRLTNITALAGTPTAAKYRLDFAYDDQGRRIQKLVSTNNGSAYVGQSTNTFIYDDWNLIAILDGNGSVMESFHWGLDLSGSEQGAGGVGGLISMTIHSGPMAGTYFYCPDGNGNIIGLTRSSDGTVAARYEYDSFGKLLRASGPMAFLNPFLFSSKYYDGETGLLYYGHRYYSPSLARWLNRDPLEEDGGMNLYVFNGNDGINKVDAKGLWPSRAPYDVHTTFTYAAVERIKGQLTAPDKVVDKMKTILAEANLSVDRGQYFLNNYWHFNRNVNDSVSVGLEQYKNILSENTALFYDHLKGVGDDQVCQDELRRLGRLSHAWQDYYAHAVALSYKGGTISGPDSTVGSINPASDPYNPDPQMKPSSYEDSSGGEHGKVKFGVNLTTGMYEPGNRAPDRTWRRGMSVTFTSQKFQVMMEFWYKQCACTKTVKDWAK
jgi:RHS repeat-associated protein